MAGGSGRLLPCEICGNDLPPGCTACPFCGSAIDPVPSRKAGYTQRVVNLEAGRPTVETALTRMQAAVEDALRQQLTVLVLIHGYGSSGKGGVIRTECRKSLDYLQAGGEIKGFVTGEDFHKRNQQVRDLLRQFPQLAEDKNLGRRNRGVTYVVL